MGLEVVQSSEVVQIFQVRMIFHWYFFFSLSSVQNEEDDESQEEAVKDEL